MTVPHEVPDTVRFIYIILFEYICAVGPKKKIRRK